MRSLFVCLFLWLSVVTAYAGPDVRDGVHIIPSGRAPVYKIYNFHVVSPSIMRGGQPTKEGLRILKEDFGVKTILSLRNYSSRNIWEERNAREIGMDYISITMDPRERQSAEKIEECMKIIQDPSKWPLFVHCLAGKDRTGIVIAAYRIAQDRWTMEDALMEMRAYGYDERGFPLLKKSLLEWHKIRQKQNQ